MKYTKIPVNTFQRLQMNAGILLKEFNPATGAFSLSDIFGATNGGISFTATPTFDDLGESIDNVPSNMMELKKLSNWEASMSGTFKSVDNDVVSMLIGASDVTTVAESTTSKFTPRNDVKTSDYKDVWFVSDFSDDNSEETGGFIAIKLMNSLNTGGFSLQSTDDETGDFAFTFTGHYSINAQNTVPFEVYVQATESSDSNALGDDDGDDGAPKA